MSDNSDVRYWHFGGVGLLNVLEREASLVLQTGALLHVVRQRDDVIAFCRCKCLMLNGMDSNVRTRHALVRLINLRWPMPHRYTPPWSTYCLWCFCIGRCEVFRWWRSWWRHLCESATSPVNNTAVDTGVLNSCGLSSKCEKTSTWLNRSTLSHLLERYALQPFTCCDVIDERHVLGVYR